MGFELHSMHVIERCSNLPFLLIREGKGLNIEFIAQQYLLCGKRIPSVRVPEIMARVRYVNLSCGMKPAPPGKFSELPDC